MLIGQHLLRLDRVESTNTVAADLASDPANDGLVVWAEEQTAGRGRMGRSWHSPPGCGVLLSVLVFPPEPLRRPVLMTALAAVAVCDTIRDCARLESAIKWPNDVLVEGRKVCGILVEQGRGTVIGIGLNVNTPADGFAAAQLDFAGSLAMFTGTPLDRENVVCRLLDHLDHDYSEIRAGRVADLESRWRAYSALLGRHVALLANEGTFRGRLAEMSFESIVLQESERGLCAWPPEAVVALSAS